MSIEETTQQNGDERTQGEYIFQNSVARWFKDEGDLSHRINYDSLNEDSIILDIGGFKGNWASDIYSKYLCNIIIFEPVNRYFNFTKNRFIRNKKIEIFNNGFSNKKENIEISIDAESTSLFKKNDELSKEIIRLLDFNEYMDDIKNVDLCKINIEGSEYDILESITEENIIKIKNIQVQFHPFFINCVTRRELIRKKLSKTHECTYCYDFVWENWKLK